jgi:hypothetical protein
MNASWVIRDVCGMDIGAGGVKQVEEYGTTSPVGPATTRPANPAWTLAPGASMPWPTGWPRRTADVVPNPADGRVSRRG